MFPDPETVATEYWLNRQLDTIAEAFGKVIATSHSDDQPAFGFDYLQNMRARATGFAKLLHSHPTLPSTEQIQSTSQYLTRLLKFQNEIDTELQRLDGQIDALQTEATTPQRVAQGPKPSRSRKPKKRKELEKPTNEILLSFLCTWHRYGTSQFNPDYVGVTELSNWITEQCQLSGSVIPPSTKNTVSLFFKDENMFGGHDKYIQMCRNKTIETRLAILTRDFTSLRHLSLKDTHSAAFDEPDE